MKSLRNTNALPQKIQAIFNNALVVGFDYAPLFGYHFIVDMSGCGMVYEGGFMFTCTSPDGIQKVECAETYSELLRAALLLK